MKQIHALTPAAALWLLAAGAAAQDEQKPEYWLARLAAIAGQPVQTDMELKGRAMMMKMTGSGRLMFADATHFRMEQKLEQHQPNRPEPRSSSTLLIADGSILWVEENETYLKRPQVQKIPIRMLGQFQQQNPAAAIGFGGMDVDPVKQVIEMTKAADITSVVISDGEVALRGPLKQQAIDALTEMLQEDPRELRVILDQKNAFPVRRELLGLKDEVLMSFRYFNVQHPAKDTIDLAQFQYTPPADHNLIDVEQLARQRANAPPK